MYEVSIQTFFSAAHRLKNYQGDCEALHGHNWKVQVTAASQKLNDIGLAVDFRVVKKITADVLSKFDHTCLNDQAQFADINPSSENIARLIYEEIKPGLAARDVRLSRVTVWESDAAWASYYEG